MITRIIIFVSFSLLLIAPLQAQLEGGFSDADPGNKLRAVDFQEQFVSDIIRYQDRLFVFGKGTIFRYNPESGSSETLVQGINANSGDFVGIYNLSGRDILVYNLFDDNRNFLGSAYTEVGNSSAVAIGNDGEIVEFIAEGQGYFVERVENRHFLSTGGFFEGSYTKIRDIFSIEDFKAGAISSQVLFFVDYKSQDQLIPVLYKINMGEEGELATASNVSELFDHDLIIFNDRAVYTTDARDFTTATGEKGETVNVVEAGAGMNNFFVMSNNLFGTYLPDENVLFFYDQEFNRVNVIESGELGSSGQFLDAGLSKAIGLHVPLVALENNRQEVLILDEAYNQLNRNAIVNSEFPLQQASVRQNYVFLYYKSASTTPVEEVAVLDLAAEEIVWQFKADIIRPDYSLFNLASIIGDNIYHAGRNENVGYELFINNAKGSQVAEEIFNTEYEQTVLEQLGIEEVLQRYSSYPRRMYNFNGTLYTLSHLQMPDSYSNADAQNAGFNTAVRDMNFLYKLNERPSLPSISSQSVAENSTVGTTIGNLSATDPDDSNLSFSLTPGTGGSDNGKVFIDGNQLRVAEVPDHEAQSSWSIRVQVRDAVGDRRSRVIPITITDTNDAPTGISLTSEFASESVANGEAVTTIEAIDQDENDSFSFALVPSSTAPGTADADNSSFTISNASLISNTTFDAQVKSSYSITLQVQDQAGQTVQQSFTITITDENEVPTDILLSSNQLAENSVGRVFVGSFDTEDADADQDNNDQDDIDFTYDLISGNGDDNNSDFEISNDSLFALSSFNFEASPSVSVRVRTTDPLNATFAKAFAIDITDANDAPTAIILSSDSINENQSNGSLVGNLSADDPDASSGFTFSLVDQSNFSDNSSFEIINETELVQATEGFDFETKDTYTIKLRVVDNGGLSKDSVFSIFIGDVNDAPTAISLSGNNVDEEQINAVAGQLSVEDQDAVDNHTYSLPADTLSNNLFQIISGTALATASPLNFEEGVPEYDVLVQVMDVNGETYGQDFTITVNDVNDAVDTLVMKRTIIRGGLAFEEKVSNIELRDEDVSDNIINFYSRNNYLLVLADNANFPDNANFQIQYLNNDGVYALEAATDIDYQPSGVNEYQIKIEAINQGLSYTQEFTIELVDQGANTPPTEINISNDTILNIATVDTEVGVLSTTDDPADTHTYSLVSNTLNNDNELFRIEGDRLLLDANITDSTQQTYRVEIKSEDNGGLSLQESITIFVKEFVDTTPPVIAGFQTGDRSLAQGQSAYDLNGTITDDALIESVELEYGPITSAEFEQRELIELQNGEFSSNIPANEGDAFGLKARVVAIDTSGNNAASDTVYFYREVTAGSGLANLPSESIGRGRKSTDYRMFSVPYSILAGNRSIRDIFETSLGQTYGEGNFKIYQWNAERETYDEFLTIASIESGEAYWFSTVLNEVNVNFGAGQVYPYKESNKASLRLIPGWNQIGNPYPVSINWEELQSNNPSLGDLYKFGADGYELSTSLQPYEGAFVLAENELIVELDISTATSSRKAERQEEQVNPMAVVFNLEQGDLKSSGGVSVQENASTGLDQFDQANPPALGDFVEIRFDQPQSVWHSFRWDAIGPTNYHVWDFEVRTSVADKVNTLRWESDSFMKGQFYLIDMETLERIDLSQSQQYAFRIKDAKRPFKLVFDRFGSGEFNLGALILGDPYPNPLQEMLTLPININSIESSFVKFRLMDMNGRLIGERYWEDELKEGYQQLMVRTDQLQERGGEVLKSGMYIYKLSVQQDGELKEKTGRLLKH